VHSGRKERKKKDTKVHGILTDSKIFHFYRVSDNGKVSKIEISHRVVNIVVLTIEKWSITTRHWGQNEAQDIDIIRLLLEIMRKASEQSPINSGRTSVMSPGRKRSKRRYSSSASNDVPMSG
jgi:hypothetical protein